MLEEPLVRWMRGTRGRCFRTGSNVSIYSLESVRSSRGVVAFRKADECALRRVRASMVQFPVRLGLLKHGVSVSCLENVHSSSWWVLADGRSVMV